MTSVESGKPPPTIDVHLAGVGTQGSGCWMSPGFRHRPTFLGLRALLGITQRQMETTVDQEWPAFLSGLTADSELDFVVALGFDGAGRLVSARPAGGNPRWRH